MPLEKRKEANYQINKETIKENYHNKKETIKDKNNKKKEAQNIKDLNDNTTDKLAFDKDYKIQINFQSCAICGYESGLNNMKLITNAID